MTGLRADERLATTGRAAASVSPALLTGLDAVRLLVGGTHAGITDASTMHARRDRRARQRCRLVPGQLGIEPLLRLIGRGARRMQSAGAR